MTDADELKKLKEQLRTEIFAAETQLVDLLNHMSLRLEPLALSIALGAPHQADMDAVKALMASVKASREAHKVEIAAVFDPTPALTPSN